MSVSETVAAVTALVLEIAGVGAADLAEPQRSDCLRLARKVSLLSHLLAEIAYFVQEPSRSSEEASGSDAESSSSAAPEESLEELRRALEAARRFLCLSRSHSVDEDLASLDTVYNHAAVQFKYVTWQLETALANLPYDYFGISDDVQEQVDLVRAQLRREMEKKAPVDVNLFSEIHDIMSRHGEDLAQNPEESSSESLAMQIEDPGDDHEDLEEIVLLVAELNGKSSTDVKKITAEIIEGLEKVEVTDCPSPTGGCPSPTGACPSSCEITNGSTPEKVKKPEAPSIPEDFRCPISLELMRDPVIVSTGQTYERAFIQRWIDCGNRTCPKTQQKLQNLILTPNYVLRSLIMQWCEEHGIEPPSGSKNDGSSLEVGGDRVAIEALVRNLSSSSLDDRKSAAAEIRSLAKRSTDNRILLAEAGAIPALVNLLSSKDQKTQEHAVTSLLNLSIYDRNKELIVLAGAILSIVQVLRNGSMEARENAAAAIFSLSLIDENKITIGSSPGAIEALVDLLQSGSSRGRKDAATALFNLCIYQANKVRAVRAGILSPLIQMIQDSSSDGSIDEALTILSVLVSHQECKAAIAKANTIPFLIDLLRSGQARNKENAAAILLALCKKDKENLAYIGRLGAVIPLTELTKSGTDRAKRKATSLLEHLSKLQVL